VAHHEQPQGNSGVIGEWRCAMDDRRQLQGFYIRNIMRKTSLKLVAISNGATVGKSSCQRQNV